MNVISRIRWRATWTAALDLGLFAAALAVYGATLAPSILPADNGEFQIVAWKLGIAHPPGFPLYTLVGYLFSRVFDSPAYALNLLSAVLAAATLVMVSRAVRTAGGSRLAGLAAAVILGASTTFWAQATTANIRMPAAFFTAWCVYALLRWRQAVAQSGGRPAAAETQLTRFALAFSLGLGHHPSIVFPGVFFVIYLLLVDPSLIRQPRRWIKPGAAFVAGLIVFAYLPLRAAGGGAFASGEPGASLARPDELVGYVLARGFEGDFFYFVNARPELFGDRVALLPTLFVFQFNAVVLIAAALSAVALARRDGRLATMLLGGIAIHTFDTLAYRAPQTVEYLMPAYVLLAILVGCGFAVSVSAASPWLKSAAGVALLAVGLARGLDNLPSYTWLAHDEDARQVAESLLADAPPEAVILSNWHWATPLWYLQQVEGRRPDVEVVYVFPRAEPLATSWLNAITDWLAAGRPVVVDMFFREEFGASPYFFEPISREAFLVRSSPIADLPSGFTPLEADFAGQFRLVGVRLPEPATTPGEPLTLFLAWRVESAPDRDDAFFAHLVDAAGQVVGQADETLPTSRYGPGDVIVERFFVAPLPEIPPGEYALVAGIFSVENGNVVPLGQPVRVTRATVGDPDSLVGRPAPPAIALSHGIYFLGASAAPSPSRPLTPGSRLTLDLRFLATRPIARDFVVSVQLIGDGFSWKQTSDSVPALGAIPTLKWIAGSEVVDRHVIDIPVDAPPGPARASVVVYDSFTQRPLAVLDARLAQQGQSIPLGAWTIASP